METRSTGKSRGSGPTTGRSNGRACISCHQRKIKCDVLTHGAPCTNCRAHDRVGCRVYEKKKHRIAVNRGPVPIRPRESFAPAQVSHRTTPVVTSSDPEDGEQGNLAEFIDHVEYRTADIGLRSRSCFIGNEISNFNYLTRQTSLHPGHDTVFHFGNRQLHPKYTSYDLQCIPSDAVQRIDKDLELKLIRAYFERINRGWPIVNEDYFMSSLKGNDPSTILSLPLLNAILLVGAHVLAPTDKGIKDLQPVFFRRAKTLVDYRFDQDRTIYVQVALLMTWYSDGLEEVVANAWHWIGYATRTALGCGMHRNANPTNMLPISKCTWVRLWWVLFQFDTMVSASYGRPQALSLEESDVPDLEASYFKGIPNADIEFAIHHTKLCIIISRAMKSRWALRASTESRIRATREADEALACFTLELPPSLQFTTQNPSIWQSTLHSTYNNFLILLHRPAPRNSAHDAVSEACSDLTICGGAATTIACISDMLREQGALSSLWLYGIHAIFTATVHVGNDLASPNPLVSVRAQKTFGSLISALRVLAPQWRFAQGLLRLFEQRASRIKLSRAGSTNRDEMETSQDPDDSARPDDSHFALRPAPTEPAIAQGPAWTFGVKSADGSEAASTEPSHVPTHFAGVHGNQYTGPYKNDDGRSFTTAGMPDIDEPFYQDFSFPDASALEFFLADMDGVNQDLTWAIDPS